MDQRKSSYLLLTLVFRSALLVTRVAAAFDFDADFFAAAFLGVIFFSAILAHLPVELPAPQGSAIEHSPSIVTLC